ncbi:MAG: glycerol-3-phosphate dehydrogenase [NAD(P)+] [Dehalococcoidia bacterium]
MARYGVLGATSWGVTIAGLLERSGNDVVILTRTAAEAAAVDARRGLERLPELRLGARVTAQAAGPGIPLDSVVVAVPAQSLRASIRASHLSHDLPLLSAAKGIELASSARMSQVLESEGWAPGRIAVLSGPNLAHEVARGLPAASVVASSSPETARTWQQALAGPAFRVYTSADVAGVELGGALKNVIAIAAGAAWGLEFGANTVASIMTRGLAEMTRLGVACGADALTFQGLAGVGDLAATCFSPLSRNRRFGELLARGRTAAEARAEIGETVEGAATAPVALSLARVLGVDLPITLEVARVVAGEATVAGAMAGLLARPLKGEAAWEH